MDNSRFFLRLPFFFSICILAFTPHQTFAALSIIVSGGTLKTDGSTNSVIVAGAAGESEVLLSIPGGISGTIAVSSPSSTGSFEGAVPTGAGLAFFTLTIDSDDNTHLDPTSMVTLEALSLFGGQTGSGTFGIAPGYPQLGTSFPVEYLDISLHQDYQSVNISWVTAQETNNSHFTILRSYDLEHFEVLGEMKGAGTTQDPKKYLFTDLDAFNNQEVKEVYYQIQQTDFDGRSSRSETLILVLSPLEKMEILTVQGLNTSTVVNIEYLLPIAVPTSLQLIDMNGREWYREDFAGKKGRNSLAISHENLPNGIYSLLLVGGTETYSHRILK
ncbi:MAG: T9SS type A sorting domain-containing protein [Bacteroidia bacterium]